MSEYTPTTDEVRRKYVGGDEEMWSARRNGTGDLRLRDKHGDVWRFEGDGLLHTRETAPFSFEHVMKKWGPLRPIEQNSEGNET